MPTEIKSTDIKDHPSYRQVLLDVERCNKWTKDEINKTTTESGNLSQDILDKLVNIIVRILIENSQLQYYQGFHDVCLTLLLLSDQDEDKAFEKANNLVRSHFKIFMQPTMQETQEYLDMILIVIGYLDENLERHLQQAEVGSIFALSWVITWFSHIIISKEDLAKLFDFFETHDSHMIIYFCACMVLTFADDIKEIPCDMAMLHQYLCQIPKREKLPLDSWMKAAEKVFKGWPPAMIEKELKRRKMLKNIKQVLTNLGQSTTNILKSPAVTAIVVVGSAYLFTFGYKMFKNQWMIE